MPEEAGQRGVSEAAEALAADGRYPEARALLEEAIDRSPRDWELRRSLGRVLQASGDHPAAIEVLSEAGRLLLDGALVAIGGGAAARAERTDPEEEEPLELLPLASGAALPLLRPWVWPWLRVSLASNLGFATLRTQTGLSLLEIGEIEAARRLFCEAVEFIPEGEKYDEPWLWLTRTEDL